MNSAHALPSLALRETVLARPTPRSRARWPLALCALVALVSATAAFTEGPLARRPSCAPYADAIRGRAIELGHRLHMI